MSISKAEHDELCCVYAGLLLFDDKIEITGDKISKVIAASGNTVESYYPDFFAKFLKSVDIDKLLQNVASSGAGAAVSSAPVTDAPADKKDDKKADPKGGDKKADPKGGDKKGAAKPKEPEPEEDDMPMGLF